MLTFGQLALYQFGEHQFPVYGLVGIWSEAAETESIHARCTTNLKAVFEAIPNINGVTEMQSIYDPFAGEFVILQEIPTTYEWDHQDTNNVQFHYNALYFNVGNDERPNNPFTNINRNVAADLIKAIMADRTRGALVQNTVVKSSGPAFYDGISRSRYGNIFPVTYLAFDCLAMINSLNQYEIST